MKVDRNADLGESYGSWRKGDDDALLDVVTSANVACGFHAGDPVTMLRTCIGAAARGVVVGAHPSYPDLVGFGRRRMELSGEGWQLIGHTDAVLFDPTADPPPSCSQAWRSGSCPPSATDAVNPVKSSL